MRVIINDDGLVLCNGVQCSSQANGHPMCCGCILKHVFDEIYENCDPLQCKKIVCAGCEARMRVVNLNPEEL